ncbi:MAG: UDP-N-acetylmuramoyl-tripeptide--D-alanyl-D-alanine ligase, partial [Kiritimatiellae bacterium]|nr:UDP-N-acetylmuramoyl-tripeptide--D-alanyl-D-alanine ligase [Kiritimatiellia bacterium]
MPTFSPVQLAEWSGGIWNPVNPEHIEGISHDTRTIARGNLYFALKGKNFDGHDFIKTAFDKGACGAVVKKTKKINSKNQWPLLQVDDPEKALRDIASAYRREVGAEIIAVTGSAGKSTVKEMTAHILSASTPSASTRGNWNNAIGLPLSLLSMERSSKVGVFELGMNHPGEVSNLCDILQPDWGIITNVGPVHIEFFDSIEAIANEKASLLKSLPKDGVAILCADGGFFEFFKSLSPSSVITVSAGRNADYTCIQRDQLKKEVVVNEKHTGDNFIFRTVLPGAHNVMNAMFAIAAARTYGMNWNQIKTGLETYTPLPMRWEEKDIRGIKVINDAYNANPLSMRVAIQTFGEEKVKGNKWLVLSAMLELGDQEMAEHISLGEFIGGKNWTGLIVVGKIAEHIANGAEDGGFEKKRVFRCKNNTEAASLLADKIKAG